MGAGEIPGFHHFKAVHLIGENRNYTNCPQVDDCDGTVSPGRSRSTPRMLKIVS